VDINVSVNILYYLF